MKGKQRKTRVRLKVWEECVKHRKCLEIVEKQLPGKRKRKQVSQHLPLSKDTS